MYSAIVESNLVNAEDFKFAGVKGFDRSNQKLLEYIEKKKTKRFKKGIEESESALYDLKDLLRGSIISDSADQTIKLVEKLFELDNIKVVSMKNGFEHEEGTEFDSTK